MTKTRPAIKWLSDVADHDFDAAEAYLSIKFDALTAKKLVKQLRNSKITQRRVNDVLRGCGRDPLPLSDPGVLKDLLKVARGEKLSPVLVVTISGTDESDVADGYHRLSLQYQLDPFATVPLRIA